MEAGGDDIWGTADAFHYYYAEVTGDFDVAVQNAFIEGLDSWTKCGPTVRVSLDADASIEGNAYLGPRSEKANVFAEDDVTTAVARVADNLTSGDVPMVDDDVARADERPLRPEGLEALPSERTVDHDLRNAGARPADRTPTDRRIVEDVRKRVDSYVDSQEEVGGYPDLPDNVRRLNVPEGGVRGWLGSHPVRVERPGARPR